MTAPHLPVLCDEVLAATRPGANDIWVDATLGAGGYTRAALAAGVTAAYAFDRDPAAHALNADLAGRVTLVLAPFAMLEAELHARGVFGADVIVFDIGVSSMQLDTPERGFSFQSDGPLDMRMASAGMSAADWINSASEAEIADVIFHLGDEPGARRIARAIVADRPLLRTGDLARLVRSVLGVQPGGPKGFRDPATRTFQAIRIHVNDELGQLDAGLVAAERLLRPGGRLAVVSFHSAEDRRVKLFLRDRSGSAPAGSRHAPAGADRRAPAGADRRAPAGADVHPPSFDKPLKAVRAGAAELAANPRARSATLRVAVRTSAPAWSVAA